MVSANSHPKCGAGGDAFTLITGNHPDMMGRAAYYWPPHGKSSMSAEDIAAWETRRIIARATREKAKDRYLRIDDLARSETILATNKYKNSMLPMAKESCKTFGKSCDCIRSRLRHSGWHCGVSDKNKDAAKRNSLATPINTKFLC
ncbi:MAG: hypothetical protein ACLUKN_14730 [Bacilli bacterium]